MYTDWLDGQGHGASSNLLRSTSYIQLQTFSSWTIIVHHRGLFLVQNWVQNENRCTYIFTWKSMKKVQRWKLYVDWKMVKLLFSEVRWQGWFVRNHSEVFWVILIFVICPHTTSSVDAKHYPLTIGPFIQSSNNYPWSFLFIVPLLSNVFRSYLSKLTI